MTQAGADIQIAVSSARRDDGTMLAGANAGAGHMLRFLEDRLAAVCEAVCVFVDDTVDVIGRLVSFPNVIVAGHQAYFTVEAIGRIMRTTIEGIGGFECVRPLRNRIPAA